MSSTSQQQPITPKNFVRPERSASRKTAVVSLAEWLGMGGSKADWHSAVAIEAAKNRTAESRTAAANKAAATRAATASKAATVPVKAPSASKAPKTASKAASKS